MKDIDDTKAPLLEHLIELRRRLLYSIVALILVFAIVTNILINVKFTALADVFQRRFCDNPRLLPETPAGHIMTFAMTPLDISATKIRTLLSKGLSARYLMPESVIAHIHDHRFYTEN